MKKMQKTSQMQEEHIKKFLNQNQNFDIYKEIAEVNPLLDFQHMEIDQIYVKLKQICNFLCVILNFRNKKQFERN